MSEVRELIDTEGGSEVGELIDTELDGVCGGLFFGSGGAAMAMNVAGSQTNQSMIG